MAWCFLLVFLTEKVTVSEGRLKENFWFMWNCKKAVFFGIVCFLKTVIHFLVVFAKGILVRAISFSDFITQTKFCGWIAICCISIDANTNLYAADTKLCPPDQWHWPCPSGPHLRGPSQKCASPFEKKFCGFQIKTTLTKILRYIMF